MNGAGMDTLPPPLSAIYDAVQGRPLPPSTLDALRPTWAAHLARARQEIHDLYIEEEGEVLYLGALSPGCRACKEGTWDCIFTTMACNLDCAFCFSPQAPPRDYAGSQMGSTPPEIAANHERTRIEGISFSGGEPFLYPEQLFEWVAWFTTRDPNGYYWVYTNGLLATPDRLQRLAELGVKEIRFNLAATGYDHPAVLDNLAAAAAILPTVTVEIPAIPDHRDTLLSSLAGWCARGVRFLNLHELLYEPGTHSASLPGTRQPIVMPDGHASAIHPASRELTLAVMRRVQDEGLPLAVNDCSLQSKLRQLRGRRRMLAPLTAEPYEKLVEDHLLVSCCAYRDGQVHFFHPDLLVDMQHRHPGHRFVRLARTAPLSVRDRGRWVVFEPCEPGEER
ncbi:MAG: radical SAM protein [Anaerolineae bacterium]|nr:radical SAM protein [Anaerolineae bacterium]